MAGLSEQSKELTGTQLTLLRGRLEAERARLRAKLEPSDSSEREMAVADPVAMDPEDFGEMAQDIIQEDTERALGANERQLLLRVERALERMDAGSYGRSEVTGEPIPYERLEALPWATTNVRDAQAGAPA
jgi:DnaK suppressor protein